MSHKVLGSDRLGLGERDEHALPWSLPDWLAPIGPYRGLGEMPQSP